MSNAKLAADRVVKTYPAALRPLTILSDLSLALEPGQTAAITGPSGCGKSTLLSILGGLEPVDSGEVHIGDTNVTSLSGNALADYRNKTVGFVFQDHHLLPQCTVLENVLIPAIPRGIDPETEVRARRLIDRVGLSDRVDHKPFALSGGERQRTAIARALINEPLLLLADEPTGNLDRATAARIADLLLELQAEQNSILIVVTHSEELAQLFEVRYELRDGNLHNSGAMSR